MKLIIDRDKEISELNEMLKILTDEKDLQSVRFAINVFEGLEGIPLDKIRAEIIEKWSDSCSKEHGCLDEVLEIIDNHISGKETVEEGIITGLDIAINVIKSMDMKQGAEQDI